jgi:hypothetical protein
VDLLWQGTDELLPALKVQEVEFLDLQYPPSLTAKLQLSLSSTKMTFAQCICNFFQRKQLDQTSLFFEWSS